VDGVNRLVERGDERLGGDRREIAEHLHLHARGEGTARACDHGHANARIADEPVEGRAQLHDELGNDEIERGAIERDPGAAVPLLDTNQGRHAV
jgi:hypothetical protein